VILNGEDRRGIISNGFVNVEGSKKASAGGMGEKSNQATANGIDLHSSFWVGQLEPGNFKRYASGVILRLLLITHALVACSHVSYGLLNAVELATTAWPQMLDMKMFAAVVFCLICSTRCYVGCIICIRC
jgi:hypothetical protein